MLLANKVVCLVSLVAVTVACSNSPQGLAGEGWQHAGRFVSDYEAPHSAQIFAGITALEDAVGPSNQENLMAEVRESSLLLLVNDAATECGEPRYLDVLPTETGLSIVGDIDGTRICDGASREGFTIFEIERSLLPQPIGGQISLERDDGFGPLLVMLAVPES